ncbi:MAG TPA: hypothetical protein VD710_09240 [Nitrososphaeraceae archaeon]|nr:hypothetical protein [Nitrososphaeraceae archaeon]
MNTTKKETYKILERFTSQKGGILFILHKSSSSDSKPPEEQASIVRDDERKSAVFEINLGTMTGLSILCECEKALADQVMSLDFLDSGIEGDVIWFGGMLDKSGSEYVGSTYGDGLRSAPVEQSELVHRVNQTIDKCLDRMLKSVELDKNVYVDASDRMSGYIKLTRIGEHIREKYPDLFRDNTKSK